MRGPCGHKAEKDEAPRGRSNESLECPSIWVTGFSGLFRLLKKQSSGRSSPGSAGSQSMSVWQKMP